MQAPLLIAAAVEVWRGSTGGRRPLEKWLSLVLAAMALNEMFDFILIEQGSRLVGLGIWVTLGLSTAILQVGVLADRARFSEKRAAVALQSERSNLLEMLSAVPVGILLEDRDGTILLLNRPLAAQLGISDPARFEGRHFSELTRAVSPRFSPRTQKEFIGFRNRPRGVPATIELQFDTPERQVLSVAIVPIEPDDAESRRRVWVSRDVTDERKMVETLQEAERMETVGTLAGGLAHDFNNQLTAILGNATLIRDALPETPRMRRRVDDLVRSAEHCAELTAGLLAFARRGPTSTEAIRVNAVFADAIRLLRPSLDPGVKLEQTVADDTPPVAADPSELRRVVTNLLLNARDAVGEHGTIRLSARQLPRDPERVEIAVEDDGVGMGERVQRHLFDPFFTTKQSAGGTGLGLSIVYGIAQAHGAQVVVESTEGSGTTIRLQWPAAEKRTPAVSEATPAATYRSTPATVLVAEDEPAVRRLVRQVLEGGGYRVLEASDGAMAVRTFSEQPDDVDLALLDLSMPHATGLEALAKMREIRPDLRAVIMSGHPTRDGVGEWPDGVPLLKKPCAPGPLLALIEQEIRSTSAAVGGA